MSNYYLALDLYVQKYFASTTLQHETLQFHVVHRRCLLVKRVQMRRRVHWQSNFEQGYMVGAQGHGR